jgi:hypothetical protein
MNESRDELRELWKAGGSPAIDVEQVLKSMEQKSGQFRSMIARRDLRETIAGAVVAILFGWFAYRSHNWMIRASELWIAAAGLWIIYWLRRNSRVLADPGRDQSVGAYYRALFDSYERQVHLLRTAKLWYVLPFWSGLMLFSFATWRIRHDTAALLASVITFNVVFGFVWWVNEWWGVRYLRRKQAELSNLTVERR